MMVLSNKEGHKMDNKLELTREELELVSEAMGLYMTLASLEVNKHKMYKEASMDRLFHKMEVYANAGIVWVKIAQAMGVPQEAISEFLERAGK